MKNQEVKGKKAVRTRDFPDVYDGDYLFFHYVERARLEGEHCAVLKKRGSGNSFKASSMAGRNFVLGEKIFTSQLKTQHYESISKKCFSLVAKFETN